MKLVLTDMKNTIDKNDYKIVLESQAVWEISFSLYKDTAYTYLTKQSTCIFIPPQKNTSDVSTRKNQTLSVNSHILLPVKIFKT